MAASHKLLQVTCFNATESDFQNFRTNWINFRTLSEFQDISGYFLKFQEFQEFQDRAQACSSFNSHFPRQPGKLAPECLHSGFYWS